MNDEDDVEDILEIPEGEGSHDIDITPPESLGQDQKEAFTYILQIIKSRLLGDNSDSLNLITHGGPGSGKSYLSSALHQRLKENGLDMLCTATTGMAASVLKNGRTMHGLLHLNESSANKEKKSNRALRKLSNDQLHNCQIMFSKCVLLLIDETSMLDPVLLHHISFRLKQIRNCNEDFGGLPILLVGDFFQLPPVRATAFYNADTSNQTIATPYDFGCALIEKFKMITLRQQMRSKDPEHTRRINRMRHTDTDDPVNSDLINTFQVLTEEDIQNDPTWKTAPVVVCSNDERYSINSIIVRNYATEKGVPILTWVKDISNTHRFDATVCNVLYDTQPQLHGCFEQGAPAILLDNLNATSGLANGTPAILDSLLFKYNEDRLRVKRLLSNAQPGQIIQIPVPSAIIASFPTLNREEWNHLSLHDSIVKIPLAYKSHLKNRIKVGKKQYVNYKSHMIELAFAITYHKV